MTVIIGAGTSITAPGLLVDGTGVTSVNYTNPQAIERLWQLGSFTPYYNNVTTVRTIGLTVYGKKPNGTAGTLAQAMTPATDCTGLTPTTIAFNPSSCSLSVLGYQEDYYATSYAYSKEPTGYGQETWQFTAKTTMPSTYTGEIRALRGICTAQLLTGAEYMSAENCGVQVDYTASKRVLPPNDFIDSESGSVSAGTSGFGSAEITRELVITQVGNSYGTNDTIHGYKGSISCSLPVQMFFM